METKALLSDICRDTGENPPEPAELYPGIVLSFCTLTRQTPMHICHAPAPQVLEINYCISGRMGWTMGNGNRLYLGPGDFSINTMDVCAESTLTLPNGDYRGLVLWVDLQALTQNPPGPLAGAGITGELLRDKYCREGGGTALAGSEAIQEIFRGFYTGPEALRLAYQRVKVLELLLALTTLEVSREKHLSQYRSQQVEQIRRIHDHLMENLARRCSIEDLSRQYLMNPTTLKSLFKAVYGSSIAAHMRRHRMVKAAQLLQTTQLSMGEIAAQVGYDSQSRFTAAFKAQFQILPTEYRRRHVGGPLAQGGPWCAETIPGGAGK